MTAWLLVSVPGLSGAEVARLVMVTDRLGVQAGEFCRWVVLDALTRAEAEIASRVAAGVYQSSRTPARKGV